MYHLAIILFVIVCVRQTDRQMVMPIADPTVCSSTMG